MTSLIVTVLVVALGAIVFLQIRKQKQPKATARKPGSRAGGGGGAAQAPARTKPTEVVDKFRGAALFPQKGACEAIMKLRGKTFAEGRIPKIPVPGCDRETCECQVHEVVGRRRGPRRIATDRRGDIRFNEDRRTGKDRREGVETWKQSVD